MVGESIQGIWYGQVVNAGRLSKALANYVLLKVDLIAGKMTCISTIIPEGFAALHACLIMSIPITFAHDV